MSAYEMESRSSSIATPPSRIPEGEWERHRAEIIKLYRDEDLSLREVMSLMEQEYCFTASEQMYKKRIAKWKLRKNISLREMEYIVRKQAEREAAGKQSKFLLNGRLVSDLEIARYRRRRRKAQLSAIPPDDPIPANVICLTPLLVHGNINNLTSENEMPNMDISTREDTGEYQDLDTWQAPSIVGQTRKETRLPKLGEDDFFKYWFATKPILHTYTSLGPPGNVEQLLKSVRSYYEQSFRSGSWVYDSSLNLINGLRNDRNGDVCIYHFYDYVRVAIRLLSRGRIVEGMVKLSKGMDLVPNMLRNQSPRLLESLFSTLLLLRSREHYDLFSMSLKYIRSMADVVLGPAHHLSLILQFFDFEQGAGDVVIATWKCVSDSLVNELGRYSPPAVMCRNNLIRMEYGRKDLAKLELLLREFLRDAKEDKIKECDIACLTTNLQLIHTLAAQGELLGANILAEEVFVAAHDAGDFQLDYQAKALEAKANVQYIMGAIYVARENLQNAIDIHSRLRGTQDPAVLNLVNRLELWNADSNDAEDVIMTD